MNDFPKPIVVISRCLEFDHVRYNGQVIPFRFVKVLEPFVTYLPICPEVEIGLGVPRDPVRIVAKDKETRLVQPATGEDFTAAMESFSQRFLDSLSDVDGFILKSRSPSCGIKDVKVYASTNKSPPLGKRDGFFGAAVLDKFPGLAIEDEGRLNNFLIREHFLTKLFTLARFRQVKKSGKMRDLVQFHTKHKFLLLAYNQKEMRILGRIVANPEKKPLSDVLAQYEVHLSNAFVRLPRYTSNINVLQHALGFFSTELKKAEVDFFLESVDRYRSRRIPLSSVLHILRAWIVRFNQEYLAGQTFFQPYPEALVSLSDSGKGRLDG